MTGPSTPRRLIVNADDFGRTAGINRGVIHAHEHGIVTSASLMVRWEAAEEAAAYARERPELSVGLHVDLTEWAPRDGEWIQRYEIVPLLDPKAVASEVGRQLVRFRELLGREPTHLDSHQYVHRQRPVDLALIETARRLTVPLRHRSPQIETWSDFYGQTSKGHSYPEGISVEALLRILSKLPSGVTELVCHPGRADESGLPYGGERALELETLCDPRVRAAIVQHGIEPTSFSGIRDELHFDAPFLERSFRQRGIALYQRERYDEAEAWFRRAVAIHGSRPWPWLWLARAQGKRGDLQGSFESARKAVEREPDWPPAILHLAELLLQEGNTRQAVELLERLLDSRPGDASLLRQVARRFVRLKQYPAALRSAQAVLALDPADEEALLVKAIATWKGGDPRSAAGLMETRDFASPAAARAAAELYLEIGRPLASWEALERLEDEHVNPKVLLRAAQALRRDGLLTTSCRAFERAVAIDPANRTARNAREVALGEARLLRGSWTPPRPKVGRLSSLPGRILHLVGKSLPHAQTGYTIRTHYLCRAQRQVGLDPQVVTQLAFPWNHGVREASLCSEIDGVLYHRLVPANGIPRRLDESLSLNLTRLAPLVRRLRPAALHAASDFRNALLALETGNDFGLPVIYEIRGFWEETWLSKHDTELSASESYLWRRDRELECMKAADRVVTLGSAMKEELVKRGVPAEKIAVVPNAVDPEVFVPVERDSSLADELGIGPDEVVLGYISTFTRYEGIRYLIEAVSILAERGHPVRGLLTGDGNERANLEQLAKDLGVGDRVVFSGTVPHAEVLRYYGLIDLFVVPRTSDRVCQLVTPLKPFEAMATGRVVIVSGVRALREIVEDGVTGCTFEPEDARSLADVAEPLLVDPDRRRALGHAAREWVVEHRTWARNGERYKELYADMGLL